MFEDNVVLNQRFLEDLLQQLTVMEGFEAPNDFYFEFGQELKKKLEEGLPGDTLALVQERAEAELHRITD